MQNPFFATTFRGHHASPVPSNPVDGIRQRMIAFIRIGLIFLFVFYTVQFVLKLLVAEPAQDQSSHLPKRKEVHHHVHHHHIFIHTDQHKEMVAEEEDERQDKQPREIIVEPSKRSLKRIRIKV
jgi:hypothetical protein